MKDKNAHNIDWELIAKDLSGELSSQEHEHLNAKLKEETDLMGQLGVLWGDAKYAQELESIDTSKAWDKVKGRMQENEPYKRAVIGLSWKRVMSVAAVLMVMLSSYFIIKMMVPQVKVNSVYASHSVEKVKLNDGSVVDLNVGSTLEFPAFFEGETRTVKLSGEAFFDVVEDASKPFVIQTSQLQIKVLGTSFNVKTNALNGNEAVTVSTGKVEVVHEDKKVILIKGEVADFDAKANRLVKKTNRDVNYKAWKTKVIEFNNTPLVDILSTIENVYNISITIDETIVTDSMVLDVVFSHDDLDHVLSTVCVAFNLTFAEVGNEYQIIKVQ